MNSLEVRFYEYLYLYMIINIKCLSNRNEAKKKLFGNQSRLNSRKTKYNKKIYLNDVDASHIRISAKFLVRTLAYILKAFNQDHISHRSRRCVSSFRTVFVICMTRVSDLRRHIYHPFSTENVTLNSLRKTEHL